MMKKNTLLVLSIAMFAFSQCTNNDDNKLDGTSDAQNMPVVTDTIHNDFTVERDNYIQRMDLRLKEMEAEIVAARAKRKAEKNAERLAEYDHDIEVREKNRNTLKEKVDAAGRKTNAEWQEFKRDVDDFFDRDGNKDDGQ